MHIMRINVAVALWAVASASILPDHPPRSVDDVLDEGLSGLGIDLLATAQEEILTAQSPFSPDELLSGSLEHLTDDYFDDLTGDHDDDEPTHTIYEAIHKSRHTTKFAELIDEHEDLIKLLNSTEHKHTLFVPGDRVFEHLPHDKKPDKEFLKQLLSYHIAEGRHTAHDLVRTNTLATVLDEAWLDGKPQRLRASVGLGCLRINFFVKVVKANIGATNGIIHAINHVLMPPTMVGRELTYFPATFSTLLYAYEKTDFTKFIHHVPMKGSTVFAPTNRAFEHLGPLANHFLFNTEKGRGYLKALLKYQIVANVTLYSDAVYGDPDKYTETKTGRHDHYDLTTLLHDMHLTVDVKHFGPFTSLWVNGKVPVMARDAVAKNGVIQVVGKVPLPPHKHHGDHGHDGDQDHDGDHDHDDQKEEITVEELVDRLQDYLEEEDLEEEWVGEL